MKTSVSELNRRSTEEAGAYVEKHFKNGTMLEKQKVANLTAHGYWMGWRHQESSSNLEPFKPEFWLLKASRFYMFLAGIKPGSEEAIGISAKACADIYIRQKKIKESLWEERFTKSLIMYGFKKGKKDCEFDHCKHSR